MAGGNVRAADGGRCESARTCHQNQSRLVLSFKMFLDSNRHTMPQSHVCHQQANLTLRTLFCQGGACGARACLSRLLTAESTALPPASSAAAAMAPDGKVVRGGGIDSALDRYPLGLSFAASELDLLLERLSGMLLRCADSGMDCVRAGCEAAALAARMAAEALSAVDRRDDFDMRLGQHTASLSAAPGQEARWQDMQSMRLGCVDY